MIICKRLVPQDDLLQKANPSVLSFAKSRPLRMIICKRWLLQMINNNNDTWGDEGVTRVTGVIRGDGTEGGEEGKGEGGERGGEEGGGEEILADGTDQSKVVQEVLADLNR